MVVAASLHRFFPQGERRERVFRVVVFHFPFSPFLSHHIITFSPRCAVLFCGIHAPWHWAVIPARSRRFQSEVLRGAMRCCMSAPFGDNDRPNPTLFIPNCCVKSFRSKNRAKQLFFTVGYKKNSVYTVGFANGGASAATAPLPRSPVQEEPTCFFRQNNRRRSSRVSSWIQRNLVTSLGATSSAWSEAGVTTLLGALRFLCHRVCQEMIGSVRLFGR